MTEKTRGVDGEPALYRYVTPETHDPRDRYSLYRLCDCIACEATGKAPIDTTSINGPSTLLGRCADCRGEGKVRQEVASCETPEAVGVALVTLGREGEWEGCAFGVLDRTPECEHCGGEGVRAHPLNIGGDVCSGCKGSGVKASGTWLVLPWLPSPRNASDAGKLLRSRRS